MGQAGAFDPGFWRRTRWPSEVLVAGLLAGTAVAGLGVVGGCAHVPREAVTLSEIIGTDLRSVRAANRELARTYFSRLFADVDEFVDYEYRPYVIEHTLEHFKLLDRLDAARRGQGGLDPLDVLQIYTEEAIARIDSFRTELRSPLVVQQEFVLTRIDSTFDRLDLANQAVTTHLRSLRRAQAEEDTILALMGIRYGTRERLLGDFARTSEDVGNLLKRARKAETAMDSLPGKMRQVLGQAR